MKAFLVTLLGYAVPAGRLLMSFLGMFELRTYLVGGLCLACFVAGCKCRGDELPPSNAPVREPVKAVKATNWDAVPLDAVVRVVNGFGSGSGTHLHPGGFVLTNNHVVRGTKVVRVEFPDGKAFVGVVVAAEVTPDLALVKIRAPFGLPAARLGDVSPADGDEVGLVGYPLGGPQRALVGKVDEHQPFEKNGQTGTDMKLGITVTPGDSGGGVFTPDGKLVGVVHSFDLTCPHRRGNAADTGEVREFLDRAKAGKTRQAPVPPPELAPCGPGGCTPRG